MGVSVSIGRGTRVRHSTGLEWDELEKAKKKYIPIRHSTGEDSPIRHCTGTEMDWRALRGEAADDEELPQKAAPHSIPAKAQEDTTYLKLYLQTLRKRTLVHHKARMEGESVAGESADGGNEKGARERFRTISLDY